MKEDDLNKGLRSWDGIKWASQSDFSLGSRLSRYFAFCYVEEGHWSSSSEKGARIRTQLTLADVYVGWAKSKDSFPRIGDSGAGTETAGLETHLRGVHIYQGFKDSKRTLAELGTWTALKS